VILYLYYESGSRVSGKKRKKKKGKKKGEEEIERRDRFPDPSVFFEEWLKIRLDQVGGKKRERGEGSRPVRTVNPVDGAGKLEERGEGRERSTWCASCHSVRALFVDSRRGRGKKNFEGCRLAPLFECRFGLCPDGEGAKKKKKKKGKEIGGNSSRLAASCANADMPRADVGRSEKRGERGEEAPAASLVVRKRTCTHTGKKEEKRERLSRSWRTSKRKKKKEKEGKDPAPSCIRRRAANRGGPRKKRGKKRGKKGGRAFGRGSNLLLTPIRPNGGSGGRTGGKGGGEGGQLVLIIFSLHRNCPLETGNVKGKRES